MSSNESDPVLDRPLSKGKRDKQVDKTEQGNGDATQLYTDKTRLYKAQKNNDATVLYKKPSAGKKLSADDATQFRPSTARAKTHQPIDQTRPENRTLTSSLDSAILETQHQLQQHNQNHQGEGVPKIINRRFVLDSPLGSGGMGTVYKAKDLRKVEAKDRNPWVAVKLLNNAFKDHPDAFISLQREARKTQGLAHPNIVRVYDFDRDGDTVYMTMELLEGEALDAVFKKNPEGLGKESAFQLIRETGGALVEAHNLNIVHSDFKPGNIFYTQENKGKVFDFGIARAVSHIDVESAENADAVAQENTLFDAGNLGALTPTYASYEMLTGIEPSPSDDLYALGCVAYQALTGKHPYNRVPADKALEKKLKPIPVKGLTRREARALRKAVGLTQSTRYKTVAEFLQDFLPENNRWTRKVKFMAALAVIVIAVGGYKYSEVLLEEQQRSEALRQEQLLAEKKAEEFRNLQALHARQEALKTSMQRAFKKLEKIATDLQQDLDQQVYLSSFADSYEWQLQTTDKIDQLDKVFRNESWIKPFRVSHPEPEYTAIFEEMQATRRQAIGRIESWIGYLRKKISNVYIEQSDDFIANDQLDKAEDMRKLAEQYDPTGDPVIALGQRIEQVLLKIQKEERVKRYQRQASNYRQQDQILADDINACKNKLAANARVKGFAYDIPRFATKVTKLSKKYAYLGKQVRENNKSHAEALAKCIQLYGYSDPKGAKAQLQIAAKALPKHRKLFQSVVIRPFNTCKPSFAEKGRRYTCQDRFINNLHTKGPKLVVIPAGADLDMFAIGKYEITESEFNRYCEATNKCKKSAQKIAGMPVTKRTQQQIDGYTEWLSQETGFTYKIPTQAQWMHAAKARGGELDKNRNCTLSVRGVNKGLRLIPATSGDANKWGLVNHVGNAQELVLTNNGHAVVGASHVTPMKDCTLASINAVNAKDAAINGFRVARFIY